MAAAQRETQRERFLVQARNGERSWDCTRKKPDPKQITHTPLHKHTKGGRGKKLTFNSYVFRLKKKTDIQLKTFRQHTPGKTKSNNRGTHGKGVTRAVQGYEPANANRTAQPIAKWCVCVCCSADWAASSSGRAWLAKQRPLLKKGGGEGGGGGWRRQRAPWCRAVPEPRRGW